MADSTSVVRCPYGHFYDEKKYDKCPLCEKGAPPNQKKSGIQIQEDISRQDSQETQKKSIKNPATQKKQKEPNTISIWKSWGHKKKEEFEEKKVFEEPEEDISEDDTLEDMDKPEPEKNDQRKEERVDVSVEEDADTRNLKDVVEAADVDKSDIKTISVFGSVSKVVVGWLIAIDGLELGHEFKIVDGKNLIGRDPNMNISIQKDNSISRDTHTVILYDAEGLNFYVLPEGKGTVYVNKEIVLSPTKLNKGDLIKIGNTLLYFLPLCGEDFDWKNYF